MVAPSLDQVPDARTQVFTAQSGTQNVSTGQSTQYNSYNTGEGTQHNYGGVAGNVIHQRAQPDPNETHWVVKRWRTQKFTGREDESQQIEKTLLGVLDDEASDKAVGHTVAARCFVIWGLGGQGKSELCLHIAHELKYLFWGVFWVDANTDNTIKSSLSDIAPILSLDSDSPTYVLSYLSSVQKSWLLVIDNADDINQDYQPLVPSSARGIILMTSRNSECTNFGTLGSLELLSLGEADARSLLIKTAGMTQEQAEHQTAAIDTVAQLLGHHTLALIQAGTYVGRQYCTFAQYPEHFERYRKRVLSFSTSAQASSRYSSVYAAFEASFAQLEDEVGEKYKDAIDLMKLLAALPCHSITLALFEAVWKGARAIREGRNHWAGEHELSNVHVDALIPLMQPDASEWDPFRLREACHLLSSLAMISISSGSRGHESISLHIITHTWATSRLKHDVLQEWYESSGSFLALGTRDADSWPAPGWVDVSEFACLYFVILFEIFSEWRETRQKSGFDSDSLQRIDLILFHVSLECTVPEAFQGDITFSPTGTTFYKFCKAVQMMKGMLRIMRENNKDTAMADGVLNWLRSLNTTSSLLEGWSTSARNTYLKDHRSLSTLELFRQMQQLRSNLIIDFCFESAACHLNIEEPSIAVQSLTEASVLLGGSHASGINARRWLHHHYLKSEACIATENFEEAADLLEKCQDIIHHAPNSRYLVMKYSLRPVFILSTCCSLNDPHRAIRLLRLLQEEQSGSASPTCPRTYAKGLALTAGVLALRYGDLSDFESAKGAIESALATISKPLLPQDDVRQYLAETYTNNECWDRDAKPLSMDILRRTILIIEGADSSQESSETAEELRCRLQGWKEKINQNGEQRMDDRFREWDLARRERLFSYLSNILVGLIDKLRWPMLSG